VICMPRKARIDAPGALHHIIIRGIERKAIFKDGFDRENFLDRLSALVSESKTACYGWALMTNHVHLLLKTGLSPVVTVMRRLLPVNLRQVKDPYWPETPAPDNFVFGGADFFESVIAHPAKELFRHK
jgi:REP element-mobilizing transposase RayT